MRNKISIPTYGFEIFNNKDDASFISKLNEINGAILSEVQGMDDKAYLSYISTSKFKSKIGDICASIQKRFNINCKITGTTGLSETPYFTNFAPDGLEPEKLSSAFSALKERKDFSLFESFLSPFSGAKVDHINGKVYGIDNSESSINIDFNKLSNAGVTGQECTCLMIQEVGNIFNFSDLVSKLNPIYEAVKGISSTIGSGIASGINNVRIGFLKSLKAINMIDESDFKSLSDETNGIFLCTKLLNCFFKRVKNIAANISVFNSINETSFSFKFGLVDDMKSVAKKILGMSNEAYKGRTVSTEFFGLILSAIIRAAVLSLVYTLIILIMALIIIPTSMFASVTGGIFFFIFSTFFSTFAIAVLIIGIVGLAIALGKALLSGFSSSDKSKGVLSDLASTCSSLYSKSNLSSKAKKVMMGVTTVVSECTSSISTGLSNVTHTAYNTIVKTLSFYEEGSKEVSEAWDSLKNVSSNLFLSFKNNIPLVGK